MKICSSPDAKIESIGTVIQPRRIPALTGLRFVLAIWVVVHHLTGKRMMLDGWAHSLPAGAQAILRGGYLAVGAFFVLSGFVLALSYGSTSWTSTSLMRYSVGRFARLYPTYLLSLLIVSPFIADYLFPTGRSGPAFSDKAAQLTIYSAALQGWSKPAVFWNTPAWSLSCELFFYLCFPLIAVCLRESSRRKILATVTLAVLLPVLLTRMGIPAAWKPVHHLADFLLGIAAAGVYEMLAESNIGLLRNGAWLYAPAAAIGTIFVVYAEQVSRAVDLNSALRPVYALLIIGLAVGGGAPARLLSTRFATHLGQASYSLYILHIPLLWWYKRFWLNPQTASALIYLVGVVMISGAVFQWVEEPANRRIRQWERDKANQKAKIFRSVGTIAQLAAGVENPQREESSPRNTFAF